MTRRSDCPISNVLDFVGDKWSFLILRDLMFFGKQSFSELQSSDEKMATNILSSRLENLEKDGLVVKRVNPSDKRKKIYTLTSKAQDMLPILLEMMIWSDKHDPNTNASPEVMDRVKNHREEFVDQVMRQFGNNEKRD